MMVKIVKNYQIQPKERGKREKDVGCGDCKNRAGQCFVKKT
jgi:hypothetical protein